LTTRKINESWNLGILAVDPTCAGASRLTIKRPVDIGKLLAGIRQKICQTSSAPATVRLYGQTVRISRFILFSGGLWTAGFSQGSASVCQGSGSELNIKV